MGRCRYSVHTMSSSRMSTGSRSVIPVSTKTPRRTSCAAKKPSRSNLAGLTGRGATSVPSEGTSPRADALGNELWSITSYGVGCQRVWNGERSTPTAETEPPLVALLPGGEYIIGVNDLPKPVGKSMWVQPDQDALQAPRPSRCGTNTPSGQPVGQPVIII